MSQHISDERLAKLCKSLSAGRDDESEPFDLLYGLAHDLQDARSDAATLLNRVRELEDYRTANGHAPAYLLRALADIRHDVGDNGRSTLDELPAVVSTKFNLLAGKIARQESHIKELDKENEALSEAHAWVRYDGTNPPPDGQPTAVATVASDYEIETSFHARMFIAEGDLYFILPPLPEAGE